jgi:hypothetical protein
MAISMAMLRIATLEPLWNPRRLRATAEDGDAAPTREDDPNAPHGPSEAPVEASQRRFMERLGLLSSGYVKMSIENGYL